MLTNADGLCPDLRRTFFSEAAFFQGVYRKNPALARGWLADARKVKDRAALKGWDAAALAAIALAEGNIEDARAETRRAIAYLDGRPSTYGSVQAAHRRLAALAESLPAANAMAAANPDR